MPLSNRIKWMEALITMKKTSGPFSGPFLPAGTGAALWLSKEEESTGEQAVGRTVYERNKQAG